MQTALRRRTTWAVAASVAAHLAVLAVVVLQRHNLVLPPDEAAGPPIPIIPVLLMPRTPPATAAGPVPPGAVRLHQRQQRADDNGPLPIAPLRVAPSIAPPRPSEAPTAAPSIQAPPTPAPPSDAVRAMLMTTLGCTEARMALMSRNDRAGCLDRLGRGARDEPYLAPALSPEKRALLDQAGVAKMARKLSAERPLPGAVPDTGKADPQDYSGEPDLATNGVSTPASHPASKRAAKVLGRLPP